MAQLTIDIQEYDSSLVRMRKDIEDAKNAFIEKYVSERQVEATNSINPDHVPLTQQEVLTMINETSEQTRKETLDYLNSPIGEKMLFNAIKEQSATILNNMSAEDRNLVQQEVAGNLTALQYNHNGKKPFSQETADAIKLAGELRYTTSPDHKLSMNNLRKDHENAVRNDILDHPLKNLLTHPINFFTAVKDSLTAEGNTSPYVVQQDLSPAVKQQASLACAGTNHSRSGFECREASINGIAVPTNGTGAGKSSYQGH